MNNEARPDSSFIIHNSSFSLCCGFPVRHVVGSQLVCVNCNHRQPLPPAVTAAMAVRPAWSVCQWPGRGRWEAGRE